MKKLSALAILLSIIFIQSVNIYSMSDNDKIKMASNKLIGEIHIIEGQSHIEYLPTINNTKLSIEKSDYFNTNISYQEDIASIKITGIKSGKTRINVLFDKSQEKASYYVITIEPKSTNKKGKSNVNTSTNFLDAQFELNAKYGIKSIDEVINLSNEQSSKYHDELEQLKEKFYPTPVIREGRYADGKSPMSGDVLITDDSSSFYGIIKHGHAGIHSWNYDSTIEALGDVHKKNKSGLYYGIRYIKGNLTRYWKDKEKYTARYEVKGTTRKQNLNAPAWASKKKTYKDGTNTRINKNIYYCVVKMWWDGECYNCVTLVDNAWNSTGTNLRFETYTGTDGKPRYARPDTVGELKRSDRLKRVQRYD